MMKVATAGLGAIALAACATQAAPPPPADAAQPPVRGATSGHTCDPANIQQFVGQQRSAEVEQEMLRVSGAATVRWVPAGTVITMEFSPERLTVFLDGSNKVERISCS